MNFNLLCSNIGITPEQSIAQQLDLLKHWFQDTVSSDTHFSGSEKEQFERYKEATEIYLKFIEPELSKNISQPNPNFSGENLISALTQMGFDKVLLTLKLNPTLLNTKNKNGLTPLHQAALAGHYHTAQALISMGADTDILNKREQYPIFSALLLPMSYEEALKQNKLSIFKLLRDKGNHSLTHKDMDGNTVLHQMALQGLGDLIKETLMSTPKLAYVSNNNTHYPIHTAILNNQMQSIIPLLEIKDGATLADSKGRMAIHYAARYADEDVLEECLKNISTINAPDSLGRTPLMHAAKLGRLSAVQTLINHQADVDATDSFGFNALHYAVKSGDIELVRWLLENTKIDINAKDNENLTPLKLCETVISETGSMEDISALLLQHGANTSQSMHHQ